MRQRLGEESIVPRGRGRGGNLLGPEYRPGSPGDQMARSLPGRDAHHVGQGGDRGERPSSWAGSIGCWTPGFQGSLLLWQRVA